MMDSERYFLMWWTFFTTTSSSFITYNLMVYVYHNFVFTPQIMILLYKILL